MQHIYATSQHRARTYSSKSSAFSRSVLPEVVAYSSRALLNTAYRRRRRVVPRGDFWWCRFGGGSISNFTSQQQSHSRSAKLVKFKRSSCGPAHTAPLQFVPICVVCVFLLGRRPGLRSIPQDLSPCFRFYASLLSVWCSGGTCLQRVIKILRHLIKLIFLLRCSASRHTHTHASKHPDTCAGLPLWVEDS